MAKEMFVSVALFMMASYCFCSCQEHDAGNSPDGDAEAYPEEVENYNYAVGTQTIGAAYGFTTESRLVETARHIRNMGSNILKTSISLDGKYASSAECLQKDESFQTILSMDFTYWFFWVYCQNQTPFMDGLSENEAGEEYDNMYELADWLLKTYKGTGREFYLGNWEGDWHLTGMDSSVQTVKPETIQGMIDWYNIRQAAVDDAVQANPDSDVKVYHYAELNLVYDYLNKGWDRIVNKVLPQTNVDFVSYSSYEAIKVQGEELDKSLCDALDAIESALKPKPNIKGKRVFIGEYGYTFKAYGESQQNLMSRLVMKSALNWGCPFVLYWEMYNNEVLPDGTQNGFWLIDNKGVKQKVYYTHFNFLKDMKAWVNDYYKDNGSLPDHNTYLRQAVLWF